MFDVPIVSLLSELGLKPTEIIILGMLWQNIKNTNTLMEKLVRKVHDLEIKFHKLSKE